MTQPDQASSLAAMPPAEQAAALSAMIGRLRDLTEKQQRGEETWAEVGARNGMTGPHAKKEAHRLRDEVTAILRARAAEASAVREELAPHIAAAQAKAGRSAEPSPGTD